MSGWFRPVPQMAEQVRVPKGVTADAYLNAVRCGVHDAWAEMLRGESGSANADVVNAIRDAVAAATRAVVMSGQLRAVPDSVPSAPAEEEGPKP